MARWLLHVTRAGHVYACGPNTPTLGTYEIGLPTDLPAYRYLRAAALEAGPGFYHATITSEHGRPYCRLGRPFSLSRQMVTLAKRLAETIRPACTGSPGVRGYQEAENASRAAQHEARTLARRQLAWLERHREREEVPSD